jgi:hypothetical protein
VEKKQRLLQMLTKFRSLYAARLRGTLAELHCNPETSS